MKGEPITVIPSRPPPLSDKTAERLTSAVFTLCDRLSDLIQASEPSSPLAPAQLTMSYPESGKATLTTGITKIDVKSKRVFLANGMTEEMYASRPLHSARSATLYADKAISVTLSLRGSVVQKTGIFESWTRFKVEFDLIEITTTTDTSFYIQLSDTKDSINRNR